MIPDPSPFLLLNNELPMYQIQNVDFSQHLYLTPLSTCCITCINFRELTCEFLPIVHLKYSAHKMVLIFIKFLYKKSSFYTLG